MSLGSIRHLAAATFAVAAACTAQQAVEVLDPLATRAAGDPTSAVVKATIPAVLPARRCDVVVIGGGLGGSAAALAVARAGHHACLTEPTHWIGGQMTSQGVSALDENEWIETTGGSASYLELRDKIRSQYRPLLKSERDRKAFNPGGCWVSGLCFEPRAGLRALDGMLQPYEQDGLLSVYLRSAPVKVEKLGVEIASVVFYRFDDGKFFRLQASIFVDATELGEFLPLAGADYVTGAESRAMTGEPDAPPAANPQSLQSFTYPFVLRTGKVDQTAKPAEYDQNLKYFSIDSVDGPNLTLHYLFLGHADHTPGSFWRYRRIIDASQFGPGAFASDFSMINWSSNDVCDARLLSNDPTETARAMQHARQVSIGFAWWIAHEAPRDDGRGKGYRNISVVGDAMGSVDGLSQFPYVRESRRMRALRTIREQDIAPPDSTSARAVQFEDSVGIGYYSMDLHACNPEPSLPRSKPFQIPLAALISRNVPNLMAAAKNIGTTHFTNGAYRLHPTEWAIGTAAGETAHEALVARVSLGEVEANPDRLHRLQLDLIRMGQPLVWYDDVPIASRAFVAIQTTTILGLLPPANGTLHFSRDEPISESQARSALQKLNPDYAGLFNSSAKGNVTWDQLAQFGRGAERKQGIVRRGEFAAWLYGAVLSRKQP